MTWLKFGVRVITMISLEITARVAFEFKPENYPAGFTADQALALELEQASQDPHEYLALPRTATAVEGRLINDGRMSMAQRPEYDGWGSAQQSTDH